MPLLMTLMLLPLLLLLLLLQIATPLSGSNDSFQSATGLASSSPHLILLHQQLHSTRRGYFSLKPSSSSSSSSPFEMIATIELPQSSPSLRPDFYQSFTTPPSTTPGNKKDQQPSDYFMFSQAGQDSFVLELLNYPMNGYFIELGANDFQYNSNSLAFERYYNWSGICVEPNPTYFREYLMYRKCALVTNPIYSIDNEVVPFRFEHSMYGGGVMGGIVSDEFENTEVKASDVQLHTVTLNTLLRYFNAPTVVQYLSMDLEGSEFEALKLFDFKSHTFLTISIERPSELLHRLLTSNNYWAVIQLPLLQQLLLVDSEPVNQRFGEVFYVHESIPNFRSIMAKYRRPIDGTLNNVTWGGASHEYLDDPIWVNAAAAAAVSTTENIVMGIDKGIDHSTKLDLNSRTSVPFLSSAGVEETKPQTPSPSTPLSSYSPTFTINFESINTSIPFNLTIVGTEALHRKTSAFCDEHYVISMDDSGDHYFWGPYKSKFGNDFERTRMQCMDFLYNLVEGTILRETFHIKGRDVLRTAFPNNIVTALNPDHNSPAAAALPVDTSVLVHSLDGKRLLKADVGGHTLGLDRVKVIWDRQDYSSSNNNIRSSKSNKDSSSSSSSSSSVLPSLTIGRFVQFHDNIKLVICGDFTSTSSTKGASTSESTTSTSMNTKHNNDNDDINIANNNSDDKNHSRNILEDDVKKEDEDDKGIRYFDMHAAAHPLLQYTNAGLSYNYSYCRESLTDAVDDGGGGSGGRGAIYIGNDVFIGNDVIVLPGAVINDGCIVQSHSVVKGRLPPYSISQGSPARVIGYRRVEPIS